MKSVISIDDAETGETALLIENTVSFRAFCQHKDARREGPRRAKLFFITARFP